MEQRGRGKLSRDLPVGTARSEMRATGAYNNERKSARKHDDDTDDLIPGVISHKNRGGPHPSEQGRSEEARTPGDRLPL